MLTAKQARELVEFVEQRDITRLSTQTGCALQVDDDDNHKIFVGIIGHTRNESLIACANTNTSEDGSMHKHTDGGSVHAVGEGHWRTTIIHPLYFEITRFPRKGTAAYFLQELTPLQLPIDELPTGIGEAYEAGRHKNLHVKIPFRDCNCINYPDIWRALEMIYYLYCQPYQPGEWQ